MRIRPIPGCFPFILQLLNMTDQIREFEMKPNVGGADRVLRLIVGIILVLVPLIGVAIVPALAQIGGWVWVIGAVGLALVLSALFRFCPAYTVLGINSCPRR